MKAGLTVKIPLWYSWLMSPEDPKLDIIPLERIVVVTPIDLAEISRCSLTVVEKDTPEVGEVIVVGGSGYFDNGNSKPKLQVKIGDIVTYRKYGKSPFYIHGKQVSFMIYEDVLAVIGRKK